MSNRSFRYQPVADASTPGTAGTDGTVLNAPTARSQPLEPMAFSPPRAARSGSRIYHRRHLFDICSGMAEWWSALFRGEDPLLGDSPAGCIPHPRVFGVYFAGTLFTVGWWMFADGVGYSATRPMDMPIGFEDWLPGLGCTLGLIMINMVSKGMMAGDGDWSYNSGDGTGWKSRLWFFLGLSLAIGSLGGAAADYGIKFRGQQDAYPGLMVVVQCVLIFVSAIVLWGVRNASDMDGSIRL